MTLWTGLAPEKFSADILAELRERWRQGPQRVWRESEEMLYPSQRGSLNRLSAIPTQEELSTHSRFVTTFVRAGCSIFVEDKVFARCQTLNKPITEDEVTKFKADLKNLKPEDIFKGLQEKKKEEKEKPPKKDDGEDPEPGEETED